MIRSDRSEGDMLRFGTRQEDGRISKGPLSTPRTDAQTYRREPRASYTYLSFAIPVGIGSVAGQPRGRFAPHPVTGLICSLTLGTLLRSRVVLSVSARPRPMSREFDLPKEGRFCGLAFAIARVR